MSDTLLWGSARPRIRLGTAAQTNGTNYVLNQPPGEYDDNFPKQIILNESVLTGYLNEHKEGHRGIFTFDYEYLDRPSCERLIDIFNSSSDKYLRPYFNYYKEYKIRVVNEWELDRFGKANQSYSGTLQFETIPLETTIPSESFGSYSFDGSTKVDCTLAATLSGDCSVEMWIKTPSSFSAEEELFSMTSAGVSWTVTINTSGKIVFVTDDGSGDTKTSAGTLSTSTWHYVVVSRHDTSYKDIGIDDSFGTPQNDGKAANAITATTLGAATDAFSGYVQIYRIINDDTSGATAYAQHSIEAIGSTPLGNIKLWWDFSQGSETDLSTNGNDGTTTGTETYVEESFPDNGSEYLT